MVPKVRENMRASKEDKLPEKELVAQIGYA